MLWTRPDEVVQDVHRNQLSTEAGRWSSEVLRRAVHLARRPAAQIEHLWKSMDDTGRTGP